MSIARNIGSAVCGTLDGLDVSTTSLCADNTSILTIGFALLVTAGAGILGFAITRWT